MGKIKDEVTKILDDLTSLEVATFSGPLTLGEIIDKDGDKTTVKTNEIFETVRGAFKDASIVGYSKFELDGDTINYISDQTNQETVFLLEAHKSMVAAAQESRAGLIKFVGSIIGFNKI